MRIHPHLLITLIVPLAAVAACEAQPAPAASEPTLSAAPAGAPTLTGAAAPVAAAVGQAAPDFTLPDQDGQPVSLSSFRGKTVVLEWFNPDCPFVEFAHGEGPLKQMPGRHQQKGVVWLAINSGAPGQQGAGAERNRQARGQFGMDYRVLIDEAGTVGRQYGAKTTPHMYLIDGSGQLVYRGALDNAPMGRVRGAALETYTENSLTAVSGGLPLAVPETQPYGCSVKYLN